MASRLYAFGDGSEAETSENTTQSIDGTCEV